jgi:endoglucanase
MSQIRLRRSLHWCALVIGLIGGAQTAAAEGTPEAFAALARLGPGINLGNALDAPREGDWGVVLEERDFSGVAKVGFRHIRLPVRWSAHAEEAPPFRIDPAFFERVDWALNQAFAHGLSVVMNVHHYNEMMVEPELHRPRLMAIWQQVAERYAGAPDLLYFELFNEPHGALEAVWNEVLAENLAVVRRSNPTRPVIVGPIGYNSIYFLPELELPPDPALIVTVHNYLPAEFTHQGASWREGADAWLGTTWLGGWSEQAELTRQFDQAEEWAQDNGVPLYLGEFGAITKADMASRVRWTSFVRSEAERRGWAWAYWELRSTFAAFDAASGRWTALLGALLPAPAGSSG